MHEPAGDGTGQGQQRQQQQQQEQEQQPQQMQQPLRRRPAGTAANPMTQLQTPPLSQHHVPGFSSLLQPSSGHIAGHQQQLASFKSSVWAYVTPILGLLYMLSPLDIIPDIIPIIGKLLLASMLRYSSHELYAYRSTRHSSYVLLLRTWPSVGCLFSVPHKSVSVLCAYGQTRECCPACWCPAGWMDDLLVLMYVVWTVWGMMNAQSRSSRDDPPHRNWPR